MAQWRSRGSSSFGRNLTTWLARAGLLLGAAGTVAAGDPPPQDIQPCEQRLVVVAAPGLDFRETDLCDPIPMMSPDPCAATWGIDASGLNWTRLPPGAPNPEFTSACWLQVARLFDSCSIQGAPWGTWSLFEGPAGYPLNINLFGTPSIGDFLPPSPSLGGSSAALLPPGAAGAPTGWRGLERPVHEGAVDLITGLPLARVSELELPFGGATFRLIRTRSQSNNLEVYACSGGSVIDSWWDWAGNGWMISESPLLLIDSAVPDIVGNGPRTTYLVLDAHHSIPFMRLEDSGRYEAPARFRATLTHNGRWESGGWQDMPTTYTASLYDGALTYTFVVIREDVPDNRWDTSHANQTCTAVGGEPQSGSWCVSSLHSRPYFLEQLSNPDGWNPAELGRNPGQGVPYYGLCTRIEDQYGHAVEITFGTQTQYALDNPQSPGPAGSADPCVECMQDCPGKGQIRSIRLTKREGSGDPTTYWTLLYRYRIAPSWPWLGTDEPCGPDGPLNWALQIPNRYDHFGPRVVDSIFVYRGDEDLQSVPPSALTISTASKMYEAPAGPTDASLDTDAPLGGIPSGWLHRIRYHYGFNYNNAQSDPLLEGMLDGLPRLLKISAISRTQTGETVGEPSTTRNWVFDYGESSGHNKELWLAAIYEPEAVDRAVNFARSTLGTFGVNHLALGLDAAHRYAANFEIQGSDVLAGVREAATVRWTRDPVLGVEDPTSLRTILPNSRPGYVRTDENVVEGRYDRHSAGDAQVATLVARTAEGGVRYHRFRRLAAGSELVNPVEYPFPHRSAFHAPYSWKGYVVSSQSPPASPPSDYTKPRWITIIDEFEDQAAMEAGGSLQASGYFLPDDLTSRSKFIGRRVVHVGASGVILRDHSWRFRDGELMDAAGAGLGAEYIYWPVEDFLASEDASRALPVVLENAYDWLAHLRNELLLIEHRSVGWSVAENQGTGAQSGFVRFFEYELLRYDGDPAVLGTALGNGWYTDSVGKVELKAEGVKEGQAHEVDSGGNLVRSTSGGPRLYLREVFRPEDPSVLGPLPSGWTPPDSTGRWEYLCDVRYLTPTLYADRLLQAPAPGGEPVMTPGDRPEPAYAAAITLTQRREPSSSEFTPAFSLPVQSTLTVGPGRQQRPGGPWYFPVQRNQHDVDGKLVRTMSGLVRDPINPGSVSDPLQSLAHTVNIYDSNGRVRHTIADVHVGAQGELPTVTELLAIQRWPRPVEAEVLPDELSSVPSECWPAGWPRLEAAAARNYITTYAYNNLGERLSDVYFPNGRRWASRIVGIYADESPGDPQRRTLKWNSDSFIDYSTLDPLPPTEVYAREYIFNEIEAGGGDLTSRVVGEIRDYNSQDAVGAPAITRRVFFATATDHTDIQDAYPLGAFLVGAGPQNQPRFMEEQRVEYGVDSSGRLRRADLLETGPNGTIVEVGSREVYDLVDVVREFAFDGAITRTTRNFLGQPVRRYIGTDDDAWTVQAASTTGLALVERYEYGSGTSDAWLPTVVRRYTDHPAWDTDAFCDPPALDPAGYATVTGYDWRMRAVRVDQYGETAAGDRDPSVAPRLTTTLTYLDHAGRPIVVATFGAGALTIPADLDPVQRREWPTWSRPSISQLYNLAVKPTSVVETFYGPDGETVERRTYHYDPTASAPEQLTWHEEHTYAGRGGQTVYEQRPSQPVTVSLLDGLARTVSTQRLGVWTGTQWEHELSRTDFELDADGNAGATAQFERILATGDALLAEGASANAVRTRSVAWFDPQKRLTASAELGSESRRLDLTGESRLIAGQPWYVRNVNDGNADEPRINADPVEIDPGELPPWALLSINRYSILTGRLIWSSSPDGSITELGYDRAGRLVSRTENRFGDVGELSRTTEYEYTLGRLTGIAVSRTSGAPVSGDRQVTRLVYGAKLLEEKPSATPGSSPPLYEDSGVHHASLIGRMHLPVAATGEPSFTRPEEIPLVHEDPGLDSGEIVLRYTFDGALAERIDARGVVFRYFYDALGRLSWLVVGSYSGGQFATKLLTSMLDGPVPVDRIMSIQYLYNAEGRLSDVISRTNAGDPASVLTHTRYEYDGRGNLLREWQGHTGHLGTTPPATTACVDYEWSYQPTDTPQGKLGRDRLAAIIYPRPPNGLEADRRRVNLEYGAPGASIDDTISRITSIKSGHNGVYPSVAQFEYAGVARRAAMTLGSGGSELSADLREPESGSDPIGLHGLDMFGRLRDLHFRNTAPGGGETLFRARHAYDDAGNRLYDDITQWPSPALLSGSQHVLSARSQLHGYDSLHRLTDSMVAQVDLTDPEAPDHVANSVLREDTWWLDVLGNWQPIPGLPVRPPTPAGTPPAISMGSTPARRWRRPAAPAWAGPLWRGRTPVRPPMWTPTTCSSRRSPTAATRSPTFSTEPYQAATGTRRRSRSGTTRRATWSSMARSSTTTMRGAAWSASTPARSIRAQPRSPAGRTRTSPLVRCSSTSRTTGWGGISAPSPPSPRRRPPPSAMSAPSGSTTTASAASPRRGSTRPRTSAPR